MLKLVKRRGSPYWYVRGTILGVPVFKSTGIPIRYRRAANAKKSEMETAAKSAAKPYSK